MITKEWGNREKSIYAGKRSWEERGEKAPEWLYCDYASFLLFLSRQYEDWDEFVDFMEKGKD